MGNKEVDDALSNKRKIRARNSASETALETQTERKKTLRRYSLGENDKPVNFLKPKDPKPTTKAEEQQDDVKMSQEVIEIEKNSVKEPATQNPSGDTVVSRQVVEIERDIVEERTTQKTPEETVVKVSEQVLDIEKDIVKEPANQNPSGETVVSRQVVEIERDIVEEPTTQKTPEETEVKASEQVLDIEKDIVKEQQATQEPPEETQKPDKGETQTLVDCATDKEGTVRVERAESASDEVESQSRDESAIACCEIVEEISTPVLPKTPTTSKSSPQDGKLGRVAKLVLEKLDKKSESPPEKKLDSPTDAQSTAGSPSTPLKRQNVDGGRKKKVVASPIILLSDTEDFQCEIRVPKLRRKTSDEEYAPEKRKSKRSSSGRSKNKQDKRGRPRKSEVKIVMEKVDLTRLEPRTSRRAKPQSFMNDEDILSGSEENSRRWYTGSSKRRGRKRRKSEENDAAKKKEADKTPMSRRSCKKQRIEIEISSDDAEQTPRAKCYLRAKLGSESVGKSSLESVKNTNRLEDDKLVKFKPVVPVTRLSKSTLKRYVKTRESCAEALEEASEDDDTISLGFNEMEIPAEIDNFSVEDSERKADERYYFETEVFDKDLAELTEPSEKDVEPSKRKKAMATSGGSAEAKSSRNLPKIVSTKTIVPPTKPRSERDNTRNSTQDLVVRLSNEDASSLPVTCPIDRDTYDKGQSIEGQLPRDWFPKASFKNYRIQKKDSSASSSTLSHSLCTSECNVNNNSSDFTSSGGSNRVKYGSEAPSQVSSSNLVSEINRCAFYEPPEKKSKFTFGSHEETQRYPALRDKEPLENGHEDDESTTEMEMPRESEEKLVDEPMPAMVNGTAAANHQLSSSQKSQRSSNVEEDLDDLLILDVDENEFSEEEQPPPEIEDPIEEISLSATDNCIEKSLLQLDEEVANLSRQQEQKNSRPPVSFDLRSKIPSTNGLPGTQPLLRPSVFSSFNNNLRNFADREADDPRLKYKQLVKGNCFLHLKSKNCNNLHCPFHHDLSRSFNGLLIRLSNSWPKFLDALWYLVTEESFVRLVSELANYKALLEHLPNYTEMLKWFKVICEHKAMSSEIITVTAEWSKGKNFAINDVIGDMRVILSSNVQGAYQAQLASHIVEGISKVSEGKGNCWELFHQFFKDYKMKKGAIAVVLEESLEQPSSVVRDIRTHAYKKLSNADDSDIERKHNNLITRFINNWREKVRVGELNCQPLVLPRSPSSSNSCPSASAVSPHTSSAGNDDAAAQPQKARHDGFVLIEKIVHDHGDDSQANPENSGSYAASCSSSLGKVSQTANRRTQENVSEYIPQKLDLPEPEVSRNTKERFKELYKNLELVDTYMETDEIEKAVDLLDSFARHDRRDFFKECLYRKLIMDVSKSTVFLQKIVKRSVLKEVSSHLPEILNYVGFCIMGKLIDNLQWSLAYSLLKTLDIYEALRDSMFWWAAAEIYLSVGRYLKTFEILKRTRLLYTDRRTWIPKGSIPAEENHRVIIIDELFQALVRTEPDQAYIMFIILTNDQNGKTLPLDLRRYVHDLMRALIKGNHDESAILLSRACLEHHYYLERDVQRSAVIRLVGLGEIMTAKQLYHTGCFFGFYTKPKMEPCVSMILYNDLVEEELYLAMLELVEMLRRELGPSIDGLGQNQIPVFIQFEQVPSGIDLSADAIMMDHAERAKHIKELIKNLTTVLKRRFDPPIVVVKKNLDRRVKIQSKSLVDHLKSDQL